jgi:phosphopantothenoylcysteine decarboxylase/phosphopantothenate--cysteine ligase
LKEVYEGKGRLPHLEKIRDEVMRQFIKSRSFKGKTVLITAGATIEKLDDVRFITNKSSGKMGAAIADAVHLRGARVILLRAKSAVETRYAIQQETFETYEELEKLVKTYVKKTDIMIHTAAIGDFIVKEPRSGKTTSDAAFSVNLFPQKKLSNEVKELNKDVFLVVFKAEWGADEQSLIQLAKKKMKESDADMVVANDISKNDRGFGSDDNAGIVLLKKGEFKKIPLTSKERMAEKILNVLSVVNE